MKIFWFDCETSGLDPKVNDILTMSVRIEIDGSIVEKVDFKMQPFNYTAISPEALLKNHLTLEEIKTFPLPQVVYKEIKALIAKYVDPYLKNKPEFYKFMFAGYNVGFDIGFFEELAKKCGDKYLWASFD